MNTKEKNSSRRNVGNSLYLLVMMMDDSIIFSERQIESLRMERLENELSWTYLPRGQSTLMRNNAAEQILGNCLETFSTYLEIYSLDVEVIIEVELIELKQFCIIPVKGSTEKELVELNECRTLTIKFGIIGKTITSNERTVFGNTWLCYVNLSETTVWSANWNMGSRSIAVKKEHSKQLANMTMKLEFLRKTTMTDDKLKKPVVKLAPLFYESVFREKNRAGNVGASQLRDQKLKLERD